MAERLEKEVRDLARDLRKAADEAAYDLNRRREARIARRLDRLQGGQG